VEEMKDSPAVSAKLRDRTKKKEKDNKRKSEENAVVVLNSSRALVRS
jgi:hypothetical protein